MDEPSAELQALSKAIAEARQSPWQPRAVCRAFARPYPAELRFTMQVWITLEHARSVLLQGDYPEPDDLDEAFRAFGLPVEEFNGDELMLMVREMQRAIGAGFAAGLKTTPPPQNSGPIDECCGEWAHLLRFLLIDCHQQLPVALDTEVGHVFVLLATHRIAQGWAVAGTAYNLREIGNG